MSPSRSCSARACSQRIRLSVPDSISNLPRRALGRALFARGEYERIGGSGIEPEWRLSVSIGLDRLRPRAFRLTRFSRVGSRVGPRVSRAVQISSRLRSSAQVSVSHPSGGLDAGQRVEQLTQIETRREAALPAWRNPPAAVGHQEWISGQLGYRVVVKRFDNWSCAREMIQSQI